MVARQQCWLAGHYLSINQLLFYRCVSPRSLDQSWSNFRLYQLAAVDYNVAQKKDARSCRTRTLYVRLRDSSYRHRLTIPVIDIFTSPNISHTGRPRCMWGPFINVCQVSLIYFLLDLPTNRRRHRPDDNKDIHATFFHPTKVRPVSSANSHPTTYQSVVLRFGGYLWCTGELRFGV